MFFYRVPANSRYQITTQKPVKPNDVRKWGREGEKMNPDKMALQQNQQQNMQQQQPPSNFQHRGNGFQVPPQQQQQPYMNPPNDPRYDFTYHTDQKDVIYNQRLAFKYFMKLILNVNFHFIFYFLSL